FPGAIVIHGGSWRSGCKEDVESEALSLARAGIVAFAIDYRLACTGRSPLCGYHATAQVADVQSAVSWVGAHAAAYPGDGTRIAAIGFSAGGHLAYMAGQVSGGNRPGVQVVAGLSGPTDLPELCVAHPGSTSCAARTQYMGCRLTACRPAWQDASPLFQVTGRSAAAFVAGSVNESMVPFSEDEAFAD